MTVFRNDNQWDKSNIEFADGHIIAYDKQHRTSRMHYIDYGLGIMTQAALNDLPSQQFLDLAAVYQDLLQQKQLAAHEVFERFYESGSFAGLSELEYYLPGITAKECL